MASATAPRILLLSFSFRHITMVLLVHCDTIHPKLDFFANKQQTVKFLRYTLNGAKSGFKIRYQIRLRILRNRYKIRILHNCSAFCKHYVCKQADYCSKIVVHLYTLEVNFKTVLGEKTISVNGFYVENKSTPYQSSDCA